VTSTGDERADSRISRCPERPTNATRARRTEYHAGAGDLHEPWKPVRYEGSEPSARRARGQGSGVRRSPLGLRAQGSEPPRVAGRSKPRRVLSDLTLRHTERAAPRSRSRSRKHGSRRTVHGPRRLRLCIVPHVPSMLTTQNHPPRPGSGVSAHPPARGSRTHSVAAAINTRLKNSLTAMSWSNRAKPKRALTQEQRRVFFHGLCASSWRTWRLRVSIGSHRARVPSE
jgi:hypothetical protein